MIRFFTECLSLPSPMQAYGLQRRSLFEGVIRLQRPCPTLRGLKSFVEEGAPSRSPPSIMIPLALSLQIITCKLPKLPAWTVSVIRQDGSCGRCCSSRRQKQLENTSYYRAPMQSSLILLINSILSVLVDGSPVLDHLHIVQAVQC